MFTENSSCHSKEPLIALNDLFILDIIAYMQHLEKQNVSEHTYWQIH